MSNLSTNITALAYFANKSSCTDNGMDVSLTVRFGRTTMTGEVTLLPSADGGWTSWGSPDHWVDGKLLDGQSRVRQARHRASRCAGCHRECGGAVRVDEQLASRHPTRAGANPAQAPGRAGRRRETMSNTIKATAGI
jgi:hypothetical protein